MTVCGRIDLRRTWPTATGGAFTSAMGTAAPRHFPLLCADHARCQSRWNRSIARTGPLGIALHAAGCRPSLARVRAGAHGTGKDQGQPFDVPRFCFRNAAKSSKYPRRPPKFPKNREFFAI
jgi:hypothetical protein